MILYKRYLRLTPVLAAAILLVLAFAMYLGSVPSYDNVDWVLLNNCHKYWWSALIHIQNFHNPFREVANLIIVLLLSWINLNRT